MNARTLKSTPVEKAPTIKVPQAPQALECEAKFLSSCMQDADCLLHFAGETREVYFFDPDHRMLWSYLVDLRNGDRVFDLAVATAELAPKIAAHRLTEIFVASPTSSVADEYHTQVVETYRRREAFYFARDLQARALNPQEDISEFLQSGAQRITETSNAKVSVTPWREALLRTIDQIDADCRNKRALPGISTGLAQLDAITGGVCPSEFWVVSAESSGGKTAFALQLACAAAEAGTGIFIASAEMATHELVKRMAANRGGIDINKLRFANFEGHAELPGVMSAMNAMADYKIFISDRSDQDITDIRATARILRARHGIGLVIVDYLQLVGGATRHFQNREREVASISCGCKQMARELNVAVIGLSQVNDRGEARESRAIGHDADTFLGLEQVRDADGNIIDDNVRNLHITKCRNGERFKTIPLSWQGRFQRFEEVSMVHAKPNNEAKNRNTNENQTTNPSRNDVVF